MNMQIKRTANAGVLLTLDGVSLLLDGVCNRVEAYLATPEQIRRQLLESPADGVAFSHSHSDHYDASFVAAYLEKTAGPIIGPADIPFCTEQVCQIKGVRVTPVKSRHIGKVEQAGHCSFVIEGSACVWFTGDAAPAQWHNRSDLPKPDVLIAPYAYAIGLGWEQTKALGAKKVVLLHLPERSEDVYGLWNSVESTIGSAPSPEVYIPQMGEEIHL